MYQKENRDQLIIEGFHMAFGGHLSAQNRWVKLAELMPWEHIEEIYALSLSQETAVMRSQPVLPLAPFSSRSQRN